MSDIFCEVICIISNVYVVNVCLVILYLVNVFCNLIVAEYSGCIKCQTYKEKNEQSNI